MNGRGYTSVVCVGRDVFSRGKRTAGDANTLNSVVARARGAALARKYDTRFPRPVAWYKVSAPSPAIRRAHDAIVRRGNSRARDFVSVTGHGKLWHSVMVQCSDRENYATIRTVING